MSDWTIEGAAGAFIIARGRTGHEKEDGEALVKLIRLCAAKLRGDRVVEARDGQCPQCGLERGLRDGYCNRCGHRSTEPVCPALRANYEQCKDAFVPFPIGVSQACKLDRMRKGCDLIEGMFVCSCGATHERGPVNGCSVYRCLNCGVTVNMSAVDGFEVDDEAELPEGMAEFVCNVEGWEDGAIEALTPGCRPRVFVVAGKEWRRVGDNLIGPPHGAGALDGSVGVYYSPVEKKGSA